MSDDDFAGRMAKANGGRRSVTEYLVGWFGTPAGTDTGGEDSVEVRAIVSRQCRCVCCVAVLLSCCLAVLLSCCLAVLLCCCVVVLWQPMT
jgi:hypothetical protein